MKRFRNLGQRSLLVLLLAVGLIVTACASPPTGGTDAPSTTAPTETSAPADTTGGTTEPGAEEITRAESLDQVYQALEGLDGDEREARLLELAMAEEDTPFFLYFSVQEGQEWVEGFQEKYGIAVELFNSSQDNVLERVLQEHEAGFEDGADVILLGEDELSTMSSEGILLPLESPFSEDILPELVFEDWLGVYVTTAIPSWNADRVETGPTSWRDALENFSENMIIEVTNWDTFATLVLDNLIPVEGMTEEEAVELFRNAAATAAGGEGHTFVTQLVVSGEYDVALFSYTTRIQEFISEGAPISWEPAVEPLVYRPNGVGIHQLTDRPATSQLLVEFFLTDAQEIMLTQYTTPANLNLDVDTELSLYDSIHLKGTFTPDFDADYWRELWETEVVDQIGGGIEVDPEG